LPAAVHSRHTPRRRDTSSQRRATSLRAMAAKPQRPVPSSWFLTTSTAFSAPRGPGLLRPGTGHGVRCVSRPPSDGNRSFQAGGRTAPFPKERESARILAAQTLRRFDPRRQPLRIAAVVASTPFGPPLPQPPRTEVAEPHRERRRNPPRTTDQSGRRFRRAPGGRGLAAVPSECGVVVSGVCHPSSTPVESVDTRTIPQGSHKVTTAARRPRMNRVSPHESCRSASRPCSTDESVMSALVSEVPHHDPSMGF
jgi:hypothetical protein